MARPKKWRRVCCMPPSTRFAPIDAATREGEPVTLTVDEYETIRLIDHRGLTQEDCAGTMHIARSTVQQIYADARRKLAQSLVEGRALTIGGGDYRLCDGGGGCGVCRWRSCGENYESLEEKADMRIAVTYENGEIFQHFGHTEQFMVYDVADGKVSGKTLYNTNGSGHGALAGLLHEMNVDALICGGIGGGARMALDAAGIRLFGGAAGSADAAVEDLLAGRLAFDPDAMCSHHGQHHGDCGGHSCGEHHCGG